MNALIFICLSVFCPHTHTQTSAKPSKRPKQKVFLFIPSPAPFFFLHIAYESTEFSIFLPGCCSVNISNTEMGFEVNPQIGQLWQIIVHHQ